MNNKVRTRFAPSPTGDLHVGGARTALFNWLFTRNNGGEFILRVEDTDFDRSANKHTEQIISALKWLGLDWDEGPEVKGPHAPYFQSERLQRYQEVVEELEDRGVVYRCYCTPEELEEQRKRQRARHEPPRYSGRCRNLSEEQKKKFEEEGRDYTYRYKIPREPVVVDDIVKGDVKFPPDQVGDFIVVKSNGTPSYNFAVVVDDHDMEISHVIRGDDHLSNTPRQLYLYRELGWEPPRWCHLAMILGEDGERLSKRHGATDVQAYRKEGYLPEGILNGLALLGWSPPDGVEVKTVKELVESFSLERVNTSASRFDYDKVRYLNGKHLRSLPAAKIADLLGDEFLPEEMSVEDQENLEEMAEVFRDQLELLSDFPRLYRQYFTSDFKTKQEAIQWLGEKDSAVSIINSFRDQIKKADSFDLSAVKNLISTTGEKTGASGGDLYHPMRVAVTGQLEGPEFHKLMPLLGRERCLERIDTVLEATG